MSGGKKKTSKARQRVWTIFFTLVVTLVFGATVSFLHVKTQSRVRDNERLFLRRAIYLAAGLPMDAASRSPRPDISDAELPAWYEENVSEPADASERRYVVRTPEHPEGVDVLIREGSGLWGRIVAAVGIARGGAGGSSMVGFSVFEQAETPGLGARIAEKWFVEQMKGKSGVITLRPEKTRSDKVDEIDAITGATITSEAVRDIVNKALAEQSAAQRKEP